MTLSSDQILKVAQGIFSFIEKYAGLGNVVEDSVYYLEQETGLNGTEFYSCIDYHNEFSLFGISVARQGTDLYNTDLLFFTTEHTICLSYRENCRTLVSLRASNLWSTGHHTVPIYIQPEGIKTLKNSYTGSNYMNKKNRYRGNYDRR